MKNLKELNYERIEKYFKRSFNLNSIVYLMYDERYFKIGMATNINLRFKQIKSHNPSIKLIDYKPLIDEGYLHSYFEEKKIHAEWFNLNYNDLKVIYKLFCYEREYILNMLRYKLSVSSTNGSNGISKYINKEKMEEYILQYYEKTYI